MIKKGLVSYVVKANIKYFQASAPEHLIDILDTKEKQISQQKKEIGQLIPQIGLKRKLAKEKQESTVYEGIGGIKAAFNSILSTLENNSEYLVFTLGEELAREELKRFLRDYHRKRIEKKIKVRLVASKTIQKTFSKYHVFKGMDVRYSDLKLPSGIFIFGDSVMTVVWGDMPTAFVTTSRNNADRYKEFFEEMWRTAKE